MTRVAAIVGPTAAGKTGVSVEVAAELDAEIVSIDSMQVYRGMDVGTDKATAEMRARVRHHMLDVAPATHDMTVAEFQELARTALEDVAARKRLPLLVGGSGLHFRAVVDDLRFPPRSGDVRAELEAEAEEMGAEALHEWLAALDPVAASKIDRSNARRIVRALEVIELTGRPFSENASWDEYTSVYELAVAGLSKSRDDLYARIEGRVARMLEAGLVDEAKGLAASGMSRTARQALGYRQVLDSPDSDNQELSAAIAAATKRFARRQEAWFRNDPRIRWWDASAAGVAREIAAYFRASLRLP